MRIVAFDLSLTCTGVATPEGVSTITTKNLSGMKRLQFIRDEVLRRSFRSDLVVLEGYGFTSGRGNAIIALGELGGVVRLALYENGARFVLIPPASLKKFATGRGNAKKQDVLAAAIKRLQYDGSNFDETDALWMYAMALDHYRLPGAPLMPELNRSALGAIEWPPYKQSVSVLLPVETVGA